MGKVQGVVLGGVGKVQDHLGGGTLQDNDLYVVEVLLGMVLRVLQ